MSTLPCNIWTSEHYMINNLTIDIILSLTHYSFISFIGANKKKKTHSSGPTDIVIENLLLFVLHTVFTLRVHTATTNTHLHYTRHYMWDWSRHGYKKSSINSISNTHPGSFLSMLAWWDIFKKMWLRILLKILLDVRSGNGFIWKRRGGLSFTKITSRWILLYQHSPMHHALWLAKTLYIILYWPTSVRLRKS